MKFFPYLANQLSSQNTQPRTNDELEQHILLFKEELEAIEEDSIRTKKAKTNIQATTIKVKDQTVTKTSVKLVEGDNKRHYCTVIGCKFTAVC